MMKICMTLNQLVRPGPTLKVPDNYLTKVTIPSDRKTTSSRKLTLDWPNPKASNQLAILTASAVWAASWKKAKALRRAQRSILLWSKVRIQLSWSWTASSTVYSANGPNNPWRPTQKGWSSRATPPRKTQSKCLTSLPTKIKFRMRSKGKIPITQSSRITMQQLQKHPQKDPPLQKEWTPLREVPWPEGLK